MKIDYYKPVKYSTFSEMLYAMYNTYNETTALKFFNKKLQYQPNDPDSGF